MGAESKAENRWPPPGNLRRYKIQLMLGWVLIIASAVAMGRIASSEGRSSLGWGCVTGLICYLCATIIPLPLLDIGIGLVISFIIMMAVKMTRGS